MQYSASGHAKRGDFGLADVFISYARSDRPIAERLTAALEELGASAWLDDRITGGSTFTKVIEKELDRAGKVVVLWSKSSIESGWVCDEAQAGREQGKLIPVSIDGSQPPMGFRQIQTIDVEDWAKGKLKSLPGAVMAALALEEQHSAQGGGDAKPTRNPRPVFTAIAAAVLALLGGGYFAFSGGTGSTSSQSEERIPVLVQAFEASGSGDQDEAAMASGITDELINRLRRIHQLQIGTAHADGSAPSASFENAHVVGGNIRSNGNDLRVTVRLLRPNGEVLWSQSFDRKLVDLFNVQETIAANIASALSVSLNVGVNATAYGGTSNPEAYAAYVQGRSAASNLDPNLQVRYFEQAIALDPNYVQALSWLSSSYGNRLPTASSKQEADQFLKEMDAASQRALKAGPDTAIGNLARAWYFVTVYDPASAEPFAARSLALADTLDPVDRSDLAMYQAMLGRNREALALVEANTLIDPIYGEEPHLSFMLMMNGRYREAVERFEKLIRDQERDPQIFYLHHFWALTFLGKEKEGIAFIKSLDLPDLDVAIEQYERFEQRSDLLSMQLPELRKWANETYGAGGQFELTHLATTASYYGHGRLAVDLMRLTFERPGGYGLFFLWHPAMANARKTPEFVQLVEDVGFPKAWEESGDWGDFCKPKEGGGVSCV